MERAYLTAPTALEGTVSVTLCLCSTCNVPWCLQGTCCTLGSSKQALGPAALRTKACSWGFVQDPFPSCDAGRGWPSCLWSSPASVWGVMPFRANSAFPHPGDEVELAFGSSVQHGLQHTMQVTAGGDSSVPTGTPSACWGHSCSLPSSGMAITRWRRVCCDPSSPQWSDRGFKHAAGAPS